MQSAIFNDAGRNEWPLFTTIEDVRPKFADGTMIQVAIGGWGDTEGFSKAASTEESRKLFATNVKLMLDKTGADGVDIDWEYPGYNAFLGKEMSLRQKLILLQWQRRRLQNCS